MQKYKHLAAIVSIHLLVIGCGVEKGGAHNMISPSPLPLKLPDPKVIISIGQAIHRETNKVSITISGDAGSNDLVQSLPLDPSQPIDVSKGESWSGSNLEAIDWTTNKLGSGVQTAVPFVPGSFDHFQLDDVPTNGTLDLTMRLIPGGQIKDGKLIVAKLHKIEIWPNTTNVEIRTANGKKVTVDQSADSNGRVHIHLDSLPY